MKIRALFLPIFCLYFLTLKVFAQNAYRGLKPPQMDTTYLGARINFIAEVPFIPGIKDQKQTDICFAFAATTLLEHHRCAIMNLKNCPAGGSISPEDVLARKNQLVKSSAASAKQAEIGDAKIVLDILSKETSNGPLRLPPDSCKPFLNLINGLQSNYRNFCAKRIPLSGSNPTNIQSMREEFLRLNGWQNPVPRIPQSCWNPNTMDSNTIDIPPFTVKSERIQVRPENKLSVNSYKDTPEVGLLASKMQALIEQKKPFALAYCGLPPKSPKEDCKSHQVVVTGFKSVTFDPKRGCNFAVKISNSWGTQWQKNHHDGWVDGCELATCALQRGEGARMTWLESPSKGEPTKTLPPSQDSVASPNPASIQRPLEPRPNTFDGPIDGGTETTIPYLNEGSSVNRRKSPR